MELGTGQGTPPPHQTWDWTGGPPPHQTWDWTGGPPTGPRTGRRDPDLGLDRGPLDLGLDRGTPTRPGTGQSDPPNRHGTG